MSILIIAVALFLLVTAVEKSNRSGFARVRQSRIYQSGRRRVLGVGAAAWGRPQPTRVDDMAAAAKASLPDARRRPPRSTIAYAPPPPAPAPSSNGSAPAAAGGSAVDFFQGLLMLVNAPYERPNDALRQLRALGEGGRQWNNGLIRLHQRMADPGDMRIDPFVSEHVVRAAALGQAMVLELVEADTAMTALLNMTLAQLQERGMQIPNTK